MPLTRERGSPRASREALGNWWMESPEPKQEGKRIKAVEEEEEQVFLPSLESKRPTAHGPLLPPHTLRLGRDWKPFQIRHLLSRLGRGSESCLWSWSPCLPPSWQKNPSLATESFLTGKKKKKVRKDGPGGSISKSSSNSVSPAENHLC